MWYAILPSLRRACACVLGMLVAEGAQAGLVARSGDLHYDDVLDITWIADPGFYAENIAATDWSPRRPSAVWRRTHGRHITNYRDVAQWVSQLDYAGHSDWRLPAVAPVNGRDFRLAFPNGFDGMQTDYRYGIVSEASELSHLLNATLDNRGQREPSGAYGPGTMANSGPFAGLFAKVAYYSDAVGEASSPVFAIGRDGLQRPTAAYTRQDTGYDGVLAVADGDIARAVSAPSTVGLLFAALAGILLSARRKETSSSVADFHRRPRGRARAYE